MEGARRIKRLGQAIMILGSFAVLGPWIVIEIFLPTMAGPWELLIALLAIPMLLGGTLWDLGWILEGFLSPTPHGANAAGPQPTARAGFGR
ncbi:MAG: hypothetical protein ACLQKA_19200 [Bryobacteraceae bacterium]